MPRHGSFPTNYAANKKDGEGFSPCPNRSDLETKYIWALPDLIGDEAADRGFSHRYTPIRLARQGRINLVRSLGAAVVAVFFFTYLLVPSSRPYFLFNGAGIAHEHFEIETLRYYDLSEVQGTSRGWEREERILLCTPLRDAEGHLPMFFSHLRNFTYPHHLIDLAFLVSDSKDNTEEILSRLLEQQQADPDPAQPYGEISVIHKDFGQKVEQDVESRHGFAAQAGRRKLMAQARNWLLSAALRPYHSWVFWRDADVETCPYTVLEDLMRHDKDIIVPSESATAVDALMTDT